MRGHFDLTMLDTPGLTKELIEVVRCEGGDSAVEDYLRKFTKEGEWKTDNLIYQWVPSWLYSLSFSGPSFYALNAVWCPYGTLTLATTSAETSYNAEPYNTGYYINWENLADSAGIGTGKAKRFINDCIVTPDFKIDPNGREAVYAKFKWLFVPGEATSSVIRSIAVYGAGGSDIYGNSGNWSRAGRVRIKDSGGNPVTISKAATRSLLVEYTLTMPTV